MRAWWIAAALLLAGCTDGATDRDEDDFADVLDDDLRATDQTGIIRGVAVDPTITPIAGVKVTIDSLELETTTNENGAFGFGDLEPGTYFMTASKIGYNKTQVSTTVEAGLAAPPVLKVMLSPNPSAVPHIVPYMYEGFLACGVAVIATSVGCTIWGPISDLTQSESVWLHEFQDPTVRWTQGELVWEHTQAAGGMLIFEITARNNSPVGYRETAASPALAYWDNETLRDDPNDALTEGATYRFFGGPHPMCTGVFFGCGVTIDQSATAYVHDFYNMEPTEGWRFTMDGAHPIPS